MASYIILSAFLPFFFVQTAYSQCINRIVPNCGSNLLPYEALLPLEGMVNQLLLSQNALAAIPTCPQYQAIPSLAAIEPAYAPVVIQDSSVANNLANTLQLLIVSNLLSNTLPGFCNPGCFVDPYVPVGTVGPVVPYGYVY